MKLYLSSYRVGDFPEELQKIIGKENGKFKVCVNALDVKNTDV